MKSEAPSSSLSASMGELPQETSTPSRRPSSSVSLSFGKVPREASWLSSRPSPSESVVSGGGGSGVGMP